MRHDQKKIFGMDAGEAGPVACFFLAVPLPRPTISPPRSPQAWFLIICVTRTAQASRDAGEGSGVKVMVDRVLGNGTFGTVYEGLMEDGKLVAVKTVLQDPRFRNRELSIMKPLRHPNIVRLFSYFYTTTKGDQGQAGQSSNPSLQQSGAAKAADGGGGGGDVMLNLVMEYVPDTLHRYDDDDDDDDHSRHKLFSRHALYEWN